MTNAPPDDGSSSSRARASASTSSRRSRPLDRGEQIADRVALALVDNGKDPAPRLGQAQIAGAGIVVAADADDPAAFPETARPSG